MTIDHNTLIDIARDAAGMAHAPYSNFHVGAALLFADGAVITGANVENASYGLTLCAETLAVGKAMAEGRRGGLEAVAVVGGKGRAFGIGDPVTPCGRCRQMLNELAALGGTDPVVWFLTEDRVLGMRLSELLPRAFGPESLA